MTAKCANPACNQPFHYFRSGRIFLIDAPALPPLANRNPRTGPEYFWLCGDCCRTLRVVLDREGAVAIEPHEYAKAVA